MSISRAISAAGKSFRLERAEVTHSRRCNSIFAIRPTPCPGIERLAGDYLVTTEKGAFAISGGRCHQLFEGDTFGVAIRGGHVYLATSTDTKSRLIRAECYLPLETGRNLAWRELAAFNTSKKGRVHQINFFGDWLAVCQTTDNSIVLVNPDTGEVAQEIHPMRDTFGGAIHGDHNHINSVSQCGEVLLFCAYRAGQQALLGLIRGAEVRGYAIQHTGAHDVHVAGRDIFYSDTFGAKAPEGGNRFGFLMVNNRRLQESSFARGTGYAIRGISRTGNELIVGHSHKGERRKRFSGSGSLLRCVGERLDEITMPFAQVYDVVQLSGKHFDEPPAITSWQAVNERFVEVFDPPVYEATLPEALLPRERTARAGAGSETRLAEAR